MSSNTFIDQSVACFLVAFAMKLQETYAKYTTLD